MKLTCLFAVLCLAAASAHATVGDDQNTLYQRYGKGKQVGGNALLYKLKQNEVNGINVTIYFDGEHSSMEVFSRGTDSKGKPIPLSEEDLRYLLVQNSAGLRWHDMRGRRSGRLMWGRSDGKIMAHYNEREGTLVMMDPRSSIGNNVVPRKR